MTIYPSPDAIDADDNRSAPGNAKDAPSYALERAFDDRRTRDRLLDEAKELRGDALVSLVRGIVGLFRRAAGRRSIARVVARPYL